VLSATEPAPAPCSSWKVDEAAQDEALPFWPHCLRCGWHRDEHPVACGGCGAAVHPIDVHTVGAGSDIAELCEACCPECS
jgi:hypothetical protein